ncbi:hypothetical protein BGZ94_008790 [Podila epigama]|nr:hypothetical protein BGZ94_008790 [Podila epigama]
MSTSIENLPVLRTKKRVLIGATGSVASIKIPIIVKTLLEEIGDLVEVRVVATNAALHFFNRNDVACDVLTDKDEWDLRNWADMFIICPLDANTLAKLAGGLCDNLITCILRAWDESRPVIVCPAMNTNMWNHKFTAKHLAVLKQELGYRVIPPISKLLACGDLGVGAMAEYRTIVDAIKAEVEQSSLQ